MVFMLQKFKSEVASSEALGEMATCEVGTNNLEAQATMPSSSYETMFDSTLEVLSKQVDVQRVILEICKGLVVKGESLFFQMQKCIIDVSFTLDALEK